MTNRFASVLSAFLLSCAAGAASGQTAPAAKPSTSTTVAPLVVQAAPTSKVIELQSHHFVEKLAPTGHPELDQVVRWRDPLCVRVTGIVPTQAQGIADRIGDVAKALDLRVHKPNCRANVEIVFSDDPQAVMDNVYAHNEYLLGYYHRHEGVRLKKITRPIQAWHVTATLGEVGLDVIDDPDNGDPAGCWQAFNPKFTHCSQGVLKNVFVVVDNRFLQGNSLGLVMDYLTMVVLADPKSLDGCNSFPSVIDLFAKSPCEDGRPAPDGLTPADASYLTALYSADPEKAGWVERTDISSRMAGILIKSGVLARK